MPTTRSKSQSPMVKPLAQSQPIGWSPAHPMRPAFGVPASQSARSSRSLFTNRRQSKAEQQDKPYQPDPNEEDHNEDDDEEDDHHEEDELEGEDNKPRTRKPVRRKSKAQQDGAYKPDPHEKDDDEDDEEHEEEEEEDEKPRKQKPTRRSTHKAHDGAYKPDPNEEEDDDDSGSDDKPTRKRKSIRKSTHKTQEHKQEHKHEHKLEQEQKQEQEQEQEQEHDEREHEHDEQEQKEENTAPNGNGMQEEEQEEEEDETEDEQENKHTTTFTTSTTAKPHLTLIEALRAEREKGPNSWLRPAILNSSTSMLSRSTSTSTSSSTSASTSITTSSSSSSSSLPDVDLHAKYGKCLTLPSMNPNVTKREEKKNRPDTAGSSWFNLPATPMTQELSHELRMIGLRQYTDPKRFYKKDGKKYKAPPKYFQVGTMISAPHEYYSSRSTKKDAKTSFVDQIMKDTETTHYLKRKFATIQQSKSNIDRRKKPRLGDTKYRSKTKANKATLSSNKKGKGKL